MKPNPFAILIVALCLAACNKNVKTENNQIVSSLSHQENEALKEIHKPQSATDISSIDFSKRAVNIPGIHIPNYIQRRIAEKSRTKDLLKQPNLGDYSISSMDTNYWQRKYAIDIPGVYIPNTISSRK